MTEHEKQEVPEAEVQVPAESPREQFERERMTRRQALRKFGMTTGMAVFAMFSVDDLAHLVGNAMQQRSKDNKVVKQIAQELQQAGVALASPSGQPPLPGGCDSNATGATKDACCDGTSVGAWCHAYGDAYDCKKCVNGVYGSGGWCYGYAGGDTGNFTTAIGNCSQTFPK